MDWESSIVAGFQWSDTITNRTEKEETGKRIAGKIKGGEVIGAGSGSTVYLALIAIAQKIREQHLSIRMIAASAETAMVCTRLGIPQTTLLQARPDWSVDGADEVDSRHNLLKGRGGALFKEKLLMWSSPQTYILIDRSKLVSRLGEHFPVPVEIFPGAMNLVERQLCKIGAAEISLRPAKGKDGPVYTENGNWLLDVHFPLIGDELEREIKSIPGVMESGLFMGYHPELVISS